MPTITQLRYILAVHKTSHFGRAAAELGIAQPTLSSQIQKAEAELGVVLFDRQAKPVALTEHGKKIVELGRSVVATHEKLVAVARGETAKPAGRFCLGVIPTLAPFVLPWFLADFAKRYPSVELSVVERPTDDILIEIAANRMDAAILATPLSESSIVEQVLFYDPFYVYANEQEKILDKGSLDLADIDASRLWLLEDGHCFRAQVINLCGIKKFSLLGSVHFAGGSFETLRHLIDASHGYTLVPESYARTLPKTVRRRLIRPFDNHIPTREISLVHHKHSWKVEILDALYAIISEKKPRVFSSELADEEVLPIRVKQ